MNILARRKSMGQCKTKASKEQEDKKQGGPGKLTQALDKGFPYDDGDVQVGTVNTHQLPRPQDKQKGPKSSQALS